MRASPDETVPALQEARGMNTTAQIMRRSVRAPGSERPALHEMLAEIVPPFALVVLMVVAAAVLAALATAISAVVAAPYRLVRHLRRRRERHTSTSAAPAQVVAIESPRVAT
jgi:hypothetical protein